ncbi:RRM protein [Serendipita sp. 398]|nr:RRM protein [Serendipita sp. 398]
MSAKDYQLAQTGSETPSSIAARDSSPLTSASIASTPSTMANVMKANINDVDHPPGRTLWLGDLEPWMDDHYMVQVCSLFGWDTDTIYIPRPPAAPNATRHPNNAGYCLLVFASHSVASQVADQYGPDSVVKNGLTQQILLPNSNRPIRLDWLNSNVAKASIGRDPGPIDNAIEYSIFVGDIASDVTNADLMNVFRNPNLGLRGDFPPRLIAPFLSCCNAKVMVDSVTGISKGYGFVRFTNETDQKRALVEMQGLYCKSRPMRLSTATAKNKAAAADEEHGETIPVVVKVPTSSVSSPTKGPISPRAIDPAKIRSITTAVAESAALRPSTLPLHQQQQQRNDAFSPTMIAKIAQLANTVGHGPQYPPYRSGVAQFLPSPGLSNAQIRQWLMENPQAKSQLESVLGGSGNTSPGGNDNTSGSITGGSGGGSMSPSDPMNTTVFVGGLSPLISEDTLRTFFAPFGDIHYVKVPPGKSCGFVQFVKKADAERAIEGLSGFSIGGSKVRLSWGRIPAAQNAAQAAAAAAANANHPGGHQQAPHARSAPSTQGQAHSYTSSNGHGNNNNTADGPLSSEQVLSIVERLGPALMAVEANANAGTGHGHGSSNSTRPIAGHEPYNAPPVSQQHGSGATSSAGGSGASGQRGAMQHRAHGPVPPPLAMNNYRDAYSYPNGSVVAPPFIPPSPSPYSHRSQMGMDYGRNDYYYDSVPPPVNGIPGYAAGVPYSPAPPGGLYGGAGMGLSMSPAMSQMPIGGGGYGAPAGPVGGANVLEDQLLGTYGGGINRLHGSSLRPGGNNGGGTPYGGYGPVGGGMSTPYMGMGMGSGGGGSYIPDYDLDLGLGGGGGGGGGGYRSNVASNSFGGPAGVGGNAGGGLYSGFGSHTFGNGDLSDRFLGNARSSYMTGAGGVGAGVGGINGYGGMPNGFTFSPGFMSSGSAAGSSSGNGGGGGGGPSSYGFGEDGSPHLKPADILRQDQAGLGSSYLATTSPGSSAIPSAASSGTRSASTTNSAGPVGGSTSASGGGVGGVKTNGHAHSGGVHELTGMFGGLSVVPGGSSSGGSGGGADGVGAGPGTGGTVPGGIKSPISPTKGSTFGPASLQARQHFRADSGRY